jgi:type VI secretion system protein ImpH
MAERPYAFDFYAALRLIEALHPDRPRLAESRRAADDPVRLAQEPSMGFAPAALSGFSLGDEHHKPRMEVRFFGFLGPNGALPLHLTEYAVQRQRHHGDRTLAHFLDIFHHRWLSIFYRSWAQASPTASLDRPAQDRFSYYVGSLIGFGQRELRERQAFSELAKQYFAGLLSRGVRNAEGFVTIVKAFFNVPARVEPWAGHWMRLQREDMTRLGAGGRSAQLGGGATLGGHVWDRQHKIRLVLGPLGLLQYQQLLPHGSAGRKLRDWVLTYFGHDMGCEVQLVLDQGEVPRAAPGVFGELGWTSWAGSTGAHARDLVIDIDHYR